MDKKRGKGSILIADDTPKNIQLLGTILRENGFLVSVVQNGKQALDIVEKVMPDLILLDVMMPDMDGYEVIEELKRNKAVAEIPVIFITAKVEPEDITKGFNLGAVDYVTKPFNSQELLSRVRAHVELKKNKEALSVERDNAVKATKLKDKFVSLVAHDLRTPFNSILGFLQYINQDMNTPLHPRHKKLIGETIRSGKGLVDMIEQLLDLSRLQTGNVLPEPRFVNALQLTSMVELGLNHLLNQKEIVIKNEIPTDMGIFTDPNLYREVIQNLVSNAIKFCNKGDEITIFTPENMEDTIAIKDSGVGIGETFLPNLFKQEEKTTSTGTEGEKGTGLGLPFSYEIMRVLGGDLTVESEKGKGSVFYVRLPHVKPVIMMVDDNQDHRKLFRELLGDVDAEIIEAESGKQAIEMLENDKPHVIVLDMIMPVMNGFEVLNHIKQNRATKEIPVIALTADQSGESREKSIQLGANDFINKPLTTSDLIPRVKRFIALGA